MPHRLLDQLDRHASERPSAAAVTHAATAGDGRDLTWADLRHAVVACADRLSAYLPAGDALMICSPNRSAFTVAFLAGLRAGLRVFPISPSLAPAELVAAAREASAVAMVGVPEALAAVADVAKFSIPIDSVFDAPPAPVADGIARDSSAAALLLHSSGTTGLPKVVVRSGDSLDLVARAMAESVGFRPVDRVLACVPLCHSYGVEHGLLAPLWAGSAVRLCQGFDLPTVTAELEAGATVFPGVPFVYDALARHAAGLRFPALRRAYSAGGPLPPGVGDACRRHLGVAVSQLYGATEIGSVTYADTDLPGFDAASVGRPMRGVDVRILSLDAPDPAAPLPPGETGQVAIRSAYMLDGYLDGSPPPLAGGYFLTGDVGRVDTHGNLLLGGRLKLLIDVAGLKVNPLEVEAALGEHPAVSACVVVPVALTETVSRLKAVVVRSPGHAATTGEDLRQFLRGRLAPYKVPRVYEFRDDLPRSAAGKVLRQQVT